MHDGTKHFGLLPYEQHPKEPKTFDDMKAGKKRLKMSCGISKKSLERPELLKSLERSTASVSLFGLLLLSTFLGLTSNTSLRSTASTAHFRGGVGRSNIRTTWRHLRPHTGHADMRDGTATKGAYGGER